MEKNKQKEEIIEKKEQKQKNDFGADPDEQEMNGLYGMLETESEDRLHNVEK